MVPPGDDEHDCGWKSYAEQLQAQLKQVLETQRAQQAEFDALKRQMLGKKSEKNSRQWTVTSVVTRSPIPRLRAEHDVPTRSFVRIPAHLSARSAWT